jgi:hypothetical protein
MLKVKNNTKCTRLLGIHWVFPAASYEILISHGKQYLLLSFDFVHFAV